MAVHQAVAGDVFGGILFGAVLFIYEMSWMRSGIELSQFLKIFLSTSLVLSITQPCKVVSALKEIFSQADEYLVSLSSKTYVFEDKMTKY